MSEDLPSQLKEIDCVIQKIDVKVQDILKKFSWSFEKLKDKHDDPMVYCSVNKSHLVPKHNVKEHEIGCAWKAEGYTKDEQPFPEFAGGGAAIVMTPSLQKQIIAEAATLDPNFLGNNDIERAVPQTAAKAEQDFTRDERLALYNYVIANTNYTTESGEFFLGTNEVQEKKKDLTDLELAAAERDAKRRRASYRNKVHTNHKTQSEILREVIQSQMECLLTPETKVSSVDSETQDRTQNTDRPPSSLKRKQRSSSQEVNRHKYHERDKRREYDRDHSRNRRYRHEQNHSTDRRRHHFRDSSRDRSYILKNEHLTEESCNRSPKHKKRKHNDSSSNNHGSQGSSYFDVEDQDRAEIKKEMIDFDDRPSKHKNSKKDKKKHKDKHHSREKSDSHHRKDKSDKHHSRDKSDRPTHHSREKSDEH